MLPADIVYLMDLVDDRIKPILKRIAALEVKVKKFTSHNTLRDAIPLPIIRQTFIEIVNKHPDVVDNFIDALVTAAKRHP